jgi:hypothetical protein
MALSFCPKSPNLSSESWTTYTHPSPHWAISCWVIMPRMQSHSSTPRLTRVWTIAIHCIQVRKRACGLPWWTSELYTCGDCGRNQNDFGWVRIRRLVVTAKATRLDGVFGRKSDEPEHPRLSIVG